MICPQFFIGQKGWVNKYSRVSAGKVAFRTEVSDRDASAAQVRSENQTHCCLCATMDLLLFWMKNLQLPGAFGCWLVWGHRVMKWLLHGDVKNLGCTWFPSHLCAMLLPKPPCPQQSIARRYLRLHEEEVFDLQAWCWCGLWRAIVCDIRNPTHQ